MDDAPQYEAKKQKTRKVDVEEEKVEVAEDIDEWVWKKDKKDKKKKQEKNVAEKKQKEAVKQIRTRVKEKKEKEHLLQ